MQQVVDTDIRSAEDLNTQIKVIESDSIVRMVAERLKGDDLRAFLAPYERSSTDINYVAQQLVKNRKVIQVQRLPTRSDPHWMQQS